MAEDRAVWGLVPDLATAETGANVQEALAFLRGQSRRARNVDRGNVRADDVTFVGVIRGCVNGCNTRLAQRAEEASGLRMSLLRCCRWVRRPERSTRGLCWQGRLGQVRESLGLGKGRGALRQHIGTNIRWQRVQVRQQLAIRDVRNPRDLARKFRDKS